MSCCVTHCHHMCRGASETDFRGHVSHDGYVRWHPDRECPFCEGAASERGLIVFFLNTLADYADDEKSNRRSTIRQIRHRITHRQHCEGER